VKICFVYIIWTCKNFEKLAQEKRLAGKKLTHNDCQDEKGPEEAEMTRKTFQKVPETEIKKVSKNSGLAVFIWWIRWIEEHVLALPYFHFTQIIYFSHKLPQTHQKIVDKTKILEIQQKS
jgi:hypothetical protein